MGILNYNNKTIKRIVYKFYFVEKCISAILNIVC